MSSLNGPWTTSVWVYAKDNGIWFAFHHSPPTPFSRRGRQIQRYNGQRRYTDWIRQTEIQDGTDTEPFPGVGIELEAFRDGTDGEMKKYMVAPVHCVRFVETMKRILELLNAHPVAKGESRAFVDDLTLQRWAAPYAPKEQAPRVPPPYKKKRRRVAMRRRKTKKARSSH